MPEAQNRGSSLAPGIEAATGREYPRRVDQDELRRAAEGDADDPAARGLDLGRDD